MSDTLQTPDEFDAIIVGSGAGGGVVAKMLATAGKRVLLLERGNALAWADVSRDHLRNHRIALYGMNTGPTRLGNPRVFVNLSGEEKVLPSPHMDNYHNNAVAVGGGTLVYGAQAWRFMPQDFRMASIYGVPEGSGLSDWPISYEELEPDYERAEWEIGVCGDAARMTLHGQRKRPYPMPPVCINRQSELLGATCDRLGWQNAPVPLLINSVPYNGRAACVHCGACVGFACPSDGKNGTQNTVIPAALATGNCTLVTSAMAASIDTDSQGKVVGVSYFAGRNLRVSARAKCVVVSAGAVETARLLLNSKSDHHPAGLGNHSDCVGRNYQGHYYPGAMGVFDEIVSDCVGPGVSISTCQFNHGNKGIIGGGMLANEFTKLPIIYWRGAFKPGAKRWGLEAKQYVRKNYLRSMHVQGPVQEIPSPEGRITVDAKVRDQWGLPVPRLSGSQHAETVRTSNFMAEKAALWLREAGAREIWTSSPGLGLSGGQHQAGTARMGNDPKTSVTDSFGRVHGHDNLFVADASLHVTNGGFNPVLTIMALGYRVGRRVAETI
jgi:choline dehydrogenase-like flavoprotein